MRRGQVTGPRPTRDAPAGHAPQSAQSLLDAATPNQRKSDLDSPSCLRGSPHRARWPPGRQRCRARPCLRLSCSRELRMAAGISRKRLQASATVAAAPGALAVRRREMPSEGRGPDFRVLNPAPRRAPKTSPWPAAITLSYPAPFAARKRASARHTWGVAFCGGRQGSGARGRSQLAQYCVPCLGKGVGVELSSRCVDCTMCQTYSPRTAAGGMATRRGVPKRPSGAAARERNWLREGPKRIRGGAC